MTHSHHNTISLTIFLPILKTGPKGISSSCWRLPWCWTFQRSLEWLQYRQVWEAEAKDDTSCWWYAWIRYSRPAQELQKPIWMKWNLVARISETHINDMKQSAKLLPSNMSLKYAVLYKSDFIVFCFNSLFLALLFRSTILFMRYLYRKASCGVLKECLVYSDMNVVWFT